MTYRIELDSVRKARNASEWRNIPRARCEGRERVGDGRNIVLLAREMIEKGHDPSGLVEVWREGTPCFSAAPLQVWADDKFGKGEQPEHLRKTEAEA